MSVIKSSVKFVSTMVEVANQLSPIDYVVFGLSLTFSAAIGFYYYIVGRKQNTNREYLHANQSMGLLPVSVSLMASFMSAITLLGVPAENYMYSTQFVAINISYIIGTPICAFIFLPVFYSLNLTSAYEVSFKLCAEFLTISCST